MSDDMQGITTAASAMDDSTAPLRWPPPGLEHIHGAIWPVITLLAVGGVLMTMPMLWTLAAQPPFWSHGPFGGAWWLPSVASVLGLFMVTVALVRAVLLLRASVRAAEHGYDGRTVAYVACDAERDAGFLLQGLRQYAELDERVRHWLLRARVVAALSYATSLLWIPVAFTFGVVLAARGVLPDVASLWPLMLVPAGVLLCTALAARTFDGIITRHVRASWRRSGAGATHTREEAAAWLRARAERFGERYTRRASTRVPRLAALALNTLAVLLPLPIVLLALLSTVGPTLTRVAPPHFNTIAGRIARMDILRPYALPADSSITPMDAGETLQVLAYVGRPNTHRAPIERAPVRSYEQPWAAGDTPESLRMWERIARSMFDRRQAWTQEERVYLEDIARHPAHREFARLARAPSADIAGGRWDTNAFGGTNMWELPLPRLYQLRQAANAHLARGLLEAHRGDRAAAETTFREVVSVGLLVMRNGPTAIDMLFGSSIAQNGAHALRLFYETTGRDGDANAIRLALEGIDAAEAAARSLQPGREPDGSLRGAMAIAANANVPPGLRWESLMALQVSAGCLNANAALFGKGEDYHRWIEQTHASLVRFPSEEALFRLMDNGVSLPEDLRRKAGVVQRLVGLTFGSTESAGTCAGLATAVALH